jgi:hypothetical protein
MGKVTLQKVVHTRKMNEPQCAPMMETTDDTWLKHRTLFSNQPGSKKIICNEVSRAHGDLTT